MAEVPRTATPISMAEARARLQQTWPELSSVELDYFQALVLVETGGGKSVIQHNFGNLSAGGFYNGVERLNFPTYWRPPWWDKPDDRTYDRMISGLAPSAFRAYASPEAGMAGYVSLLKSSGYGPLRAAASQDSVELFVNALRDTGYSKDYGPAHYGTFRSIIAKIRGTNATPGSVTKSTSNGAIVPLVGGVVLLVASGVGWLLSRRKK